jgi:hypothetical protein
MKMKIDSSNLTVATASAYASLTEPARSPLGIRRTSGNICPQSGYWQIANPAVKNVVNVKKGEQLPWQNGYPVNWTLIEYDLKNE